MKRCLTVWFVIGWGIAAFAGTDDQRAKLIGSWRLQDDAGHDAGDVWILEERGAAIHVTHTEGTRKTSDFECAPTGRDCDVKAAGKSAKVSLWYNGPALVELETRGAEIVKRNFVAAAEDGMLELETTPVVPAGKPQKCVLKRVSPATAEK